MLAKARIFCKQKNVKTRLFISKIGVQELPERSRYYSALMSLDTLKAGEPYKALRDSHVIFICMEDIFGDELPVYTFENICLENSGRKLNDRDYRHFFIRAEGLIPRPSGAKKGVLNPTAIPFKNIIPRRSASGLVIAPICGKMIKNVNARSFFNFLISNKAGSELTERLRTCVEDAKHNMQWRFQYMTWERQQYYSYEEGREAGIAEGHTVGLSEGMAAGKIDAAVVLIKDFGVSPELAAEKMGVPLEDVLKVLGKTVAGATTD